MLTGDVLDAAAPDAGSRDWMRANATSSRMRAGLPPGWATADKTGSGDFAQHQRRRYRVRTEGNGILLSVMTRTRSDNPKAEPRFVSSSPT